MVRKNLRKGEEPEQSPPLVFAKKDQSDLATPIEISGRKVGSGREIVGSETVERANERFHKGGQPLNVQAGKGLLFSAPGVLDLGPPRLASFVNRQPYNEGDALLSTLLWC